MKTGIAKIVLFGFAIVAVAAILLRWKENDRQKALEQLTDSYGVTITRAHGEIHLSAAGKKITNLEKIGALIERVGDLEDGTPLEPDVLDLTGSPNLNSFDGVARFQSLRSIIAVDCPKLVRLDGISGLPNLSELIISHNKALEDISALRNLPSLITLDLMATPRLRKAELDQFPVLENLYLSSCRSLEALNVGAFKTLKQLYLDNCMLIKNIEGLGNLTQLTDLDVSNCQKITGFEGIENLGELIVLDMRNVELDDFSTISVLPKLEVLRLAGQGELLDLTPFSKLKKLRELYIESCPNLESLKGLPSSTKYVGAIRCPKVTTLKGLKSAPGLNHIDVESCKAFADISGIETLAGLSRVSFRHCRKLKEVQALENNKNLAFVRLGNTGVIAADIEPLQKTLEDTIFDFSIDDE